MESRFMDWFDAPVKYGVLCLGAYLIFLAVLPKRPDRRKYIGGGFLSMVPGIVMLLFRDRLLPLHIVTMVAVFMLVILVYFRLRLREAMVYAMVAFGISYAAFFVATFVVIFCGAWFCELALGSYEKADIFFESVPVHVVTVLIMQALQLGMIGAFLKRNRLKNGLANIIHYGTSDVGVYISFVILLVTTMFGLMYRLHIGGMTSTILFVVGCVCVLSMYFWLQREIRAVYQSKQFRNEIALLEKSLAEKDRIMAALQEDNEKLAQIIHKDNKLIPAMVNAVRDCADAGHGDENSDFAARALAVAEQLDDIYRERSTTVEHYEAHACRFPTMGAVSTDAILSYMSRRAGENGTGFAVEVRENGDDFFSQLDAAVDRHDFNTILTELVENALLAAKENEDAAVRAVSVRLERDDTNGKSICLRVSDSGKEFDKNVLHHMGRRKMTTRLDKGGSGTGLMTVSRLLQKYDADFVVEPPAEKDISRFIKTVAVRFDARDTGK